uniref:Ig-like domain-containing protein n=1 Tax=Chelonoidis abingdonii TaxID=106734 RepID=A0A8C0H742_CHEAB
IINGNILRLSSPSAQFCNSSSMEDAVTQTQPSMSDVERESVSRDCTYETVTSGDYLYWYKQPPGESLVFLFQPHSGGTKRNEAGERFSVNLEKSKSSVSLRITALDDLGDSGTYYCALSDTVTRAGRGAEQKPPSGCSRNRRLLGATGGGRRNYASTGLCLSPNQRTTATPLASPPVCIASFCSSPGF